LLEAAAQFTPVTAAVARILETTNPHEFEVALAEWRESVSRSTNEVEERVAALELKFRPKLRLSDFAMQLAIVLDQTSVNGLEDPIGVERMTSALPTLPMRDLEEAVAELEYYGLAKKFGALGAPLRLVAPSYTLFALVDPLVSGTSPQTDAVEVAKIALGQGRVSAHELEKQLGWPKRRLNPALALLLPFIADRRVRKVIQPDYVTLGFVVSAEERFLLRRLTTGTN
jgi:hypothetical protein